MKPLLHLLGFLLILAPYGRAQESPYFVTYDHHLEEPGNLDVEVSSTANVPRAGQRFYAAPWAEFEYGVTALWTSEIYLEGQSAWADSSVFTGWRFENRYRLFKREHRINPVLYLEYENINGASRIQKEIEGGSPDVSSRNGVLRRVINRELETKLILSSDLHGWNIAGNLIVTRNLSQHEGVEFGYSAGFFRPLASLASGNDCHLCRENFTAGAEMYGGIGSTLNFGLNDTAHYIAPVFAWLVSNNTTLRFSPGFGLTHTSSPTLLRFGYAYELQAVGSRVSKLFRSKH